MLAALVEFSLRRRLIVVALALALVAYGVHVAQRARVDVFPAFTPPEVAVQTEAPGLSSEQVEVLVTRRVEQVVSGMPHLESMRSQSIQGLSVVTVFYEDGTDLLAARAMLGEALARTTSELPEGVQAPTMSALTSATMDLLVLGFTSETMGPADLRDVVETRVRRRLLAVKGVAQANLFGGEVRQLQVRVRPERLALRGLAVEDVVEAARNATAVRGAGFVETPAQRVVLQPETPPTSAADLSRVIVTRGLGSNVRLDDVAEVTEGAEPRFGDCLIEGKPGVLVTLLAQFGADPLETTRAIEASIAEIKPSLAADGIVVHERLFRPATFVTNAVGNLFHSLAIGGVLVAVLLLLFLFHLRTAFVSLTAIPLSLLGAVVVLDRFGASLNTMTLGGLAIALGEVVDDAIVGVENVFRRVQENRRAAAPRPAFDVVLDAALEVRRPVVYATFTVALVFLPVLALPGVEGRMFAPLGIAYVLAVLVSLLVAVTVTPALSLLFLASSRGSTKDPLLVRGMRRAYEFVLAPLMRHPAYVLGAVVVLMGVAVSIARGFGGEFLPEFREGHFILHVNTAPGTSLNESVRLGRRLSASLMNVPQIASVAEQIGRAEGGEDPWGPHRTEWHIELKSLPGDEEEKARDAIRDALKGFPGITFDLTTFLGDRIGETLSGETASVVVDVFGDDLDTIDDRARAVAKALSAVPGAVDVQVSSPPGQPQLRLTLRTDQLARWGLRPVDVLDAIRTATQGTVVGTTQRGPLASDIVVILDPARRSEPEDVGALTLRSASGALVPLAAVADVETTTGRYMVLHDAGRRRQTVTCNVSGRDVEQFTADAQARVARDVSLPPGTTAEFSGAAEARARTASELLTASGFALFAILLLLASAYRRASNLVLVVANLPFALVGGVFAVAITGASVSVGTLVGFVTLFGVSTRNSILMLSHFEHLVEHEGATWGPATALRGASERLRPVLMTALATGLGLLPIALGAQDAGREIEGQMAIVILGGLVTSAALNLLVLPTLAVTFGRFGRVGRPEESAPAAAPAKREG